MPVTASLGAVFGFGRAQSSQNQISQTNLQIWIDSGNNASYPGSGTVWNNLLPANAATYWYTLSNGPSVSTIVYNGTSNATLYFDGVNDYATPNTSLVTLAQANNWNETREYWVYWPGAPGCLTMESGSTIPDTAWYDAQMSLSNTGLYYSVYQNVSPMISYQVFNNLAPNRWNHLVWINSKSSNLLIAYVNGVQTYNSTVTGRLTPDFSSSEFYPTLCAGSATNFGNGSATNFAGSVGVFRWYNQILPSSIVLQNYNAERTRFGIGTPITNIRLLIVGDSNVTTLSTNLQTARTDMGLTAQTLTITTQLIGAGYTGANLTTANFDVVLLYTNGGLAYNASLGTNLNTFLTSGGGHGVFGGFLWGNVGAVTNFNYANNPYAYKGTYTLITTSTYSNIVASPITTSAFLTGNTGSASANTPSPITVQADATSISQYSNGTSFIATQIAGASRRVAINQYPTNTTEYNRLFCRAIYWTVGAI